MTKKQLLSNGWTEKNGRYCHPIMSPEKYGGVDIESAIEDQLEADQYAAGKKFYFVRENRYGYGLDIVERFPKEGKWGNWNQRILENHNETKNFVRDRADIFNKHGLEGTWGGLTVKNEKVWLASNVQYTKILICEEKHGNRYFYVPTLETLTKVCRKIVLEREEEGYYSSELEPEKPQFTKEEVLKWKSGSTKYAALEDWKTYEYYLKAFKESKQELATIDFIEKNDNFEGGCVALDFLMSRTDGEYEKVNIEEMETL